MPHLYLFDAVNLRVCCQCCHRRIEIGSLKMLSWDSVRHEGIRMSCHIILHSIHSLAHSFYRLFLASLPGFQLLLTGSSMRSRKLGTYLMPSPKCTLASQYIVHLRYTPLPRAGNENALIYDLFWTRLFPRWTPS